LRVKIGSLVLDLTGARRQEDRATDEEPLPLERHRGEERFRQVVERDTIYRNLVILAFLLAIGAGVDFGKLFTVDATVATSWLMVGMTLALSYFIPRRPVPLVILGAVAVGAVAVWFDRSWLLASNAPEYRLGLMAAVAGVLLLLPTNLKSRAFFAAVATVVFLHLGPDLWVVPDLHAPLWVQVPFIVIEFLCLIGAGYRYTLASMLRLPQATYRAAPVCITARLEQSTDHPLEIRVI
jgi:hypothetical protein